MAEVPGSLVLERSRGLSDRWRQPLILTHDPRLEPMRTVAKSVGELRHSLRAENAECDDRDDCNRGGPISGITFLRFVLFGWARITGGSLGDQVLV